MNRCNDQLINCIRQRCPLIHHITSDVVANDVANACLAIGASPVMTEEIRDFDDLLSMARGIVLNTGKLSLNKLEAMEALLNHNKLGDIPVVLDPVGAGSFSWRKESVLAFLASGKIDLVKGNAGEIASLAGQEWSSKGVDAGHGVLDKGQIVLDLAQRYGGVFAISGPEDYISDGKQIYVQKNGHPMMETMTGSGCILSGILGAFLSVGQGSYFDASCQAFDFYNVAGEMAFKANPKQGPAQFRMNLIDALYHIDGDLVKKERRGSLK